MSSTSHPQRKRKKFEDLSKQRQETLKLAERIEKFGVPNEWSCLFCFENNCECFVMSARPDLKCSTCTRRGKPCVAISWDSLDRTMERKASEIEDAEEKLRGVNAEVRRMMALVL